MADLSSVNPEDFTPSAQNEQDRHLLVKFYLKPRKDAKASLEAGRPVFKDCEYIDICKPGGRDRVARPATPRDKERFRDHYVRFKDRVAEPEEGTPLSEWPQISRSAVEELAFINVKTVEGLAALRDSALDSMRGLATLKAKAVAYVEAAKEDAPRQQLEAALEERDQTIETLKQQMDAMAARLEAMETVEKATKAPRGKASE